LLFRAKPRPNGRKWFAKQAFARLARPAKRHYTFGRRRAHEPWSSGGQRAINPAML